MRGSVLVIPAIIFCVGCQGDLGSLGGSTTNSTNNNLNPQPPIPPQEMTVNSGLLLWLDAEKISGANQQAISNFPDQSGKGNDASQSVNNKMPILVKNAINGKQALRFDGINDQLDISGAKLGLTGAFDVFVVFRSLGTVLVDPGVFGNGIGNHFQITHDRGNTIYAYVGVGSNHIIYSLESLLANYVEWTWDGTKSFNSLVVWKNNVVKGQLTSSESVSNIANYHIGIASAYWAGDLSEILLFNRVLPQSERQVIQSYIKDKYDLQ